MERAPKVHLGEEVIGPADQSTWRVGAARHCSQAYCPLHILFPGMPLRAQPVC